MLKVSGVVDSLASTAQNELANLVTLFLGITVGATMTAENILTLDVLKILILGAAAFIFDTVGGVLFAKLANLFLRQKLNPMIGACGISAFPMSGRVVAKMALKEDPSNFIIQHAMGVNVAGCRRRPCACSYSRFVIKEKLCQVWTLPFIFWSLRIPCFSW